MKVLFFIGSLSGGGAERVVCNLASYLVLHNYQVEILTVTRLKERYSLNNNVKVSSLDDNLMKKNKFLNALGKIRNFIRILKKSDSDVNVVFLPKTIMLYMFFHPLIKKPVIVSERNSPQQYGKLMQLMMQICFKKADRCVFQTTSAMDYYIRNGISKDKCFVIPNAVEVVSEDKRGKKDYIIAAAGRFTAQKNFFLLLRAFKRIHKKYPQYKLVIYGDGSLRKDYERFVHINKLEKFVKLPGYVSNIHEKIQKAHMFVLSSNYEGMPNVLMEAMALGLPCIATDCPCGGPSMLIKDGYNGILIHVKDEDALVGSIQRYIEDTRFAEMCAGKAKMVSRQFSPKKIDKAWESIIQGLI